MSDHAINLALLIIGIITSLFEAGILWMILQDYRKDRGMPELSLRRLTVLLGLSLGPILALLVIYLFATALRPKLTEGAIPPGEHPLPTTSAKTREQWNAMLGKLEIITDRIFTDTDVHLDGKEFMSCTFNRVRFWYHGTAPARIEKCDVDAYSRTHLTTDNPALGGGLELLEGLGMLKGSEVRQHASPDDAK